MPRLSILIPALGDLDALEATLVSVLENRPGDCEVVAVLDHAYADPYDLRDEVRFVTARRPAGLVEAVNFGLDACRGGIVHLLAAGGRVSEGWADLAMAHFADPRIAAVAPLVLDASRDRIASAGLEYRAGGARIERLAGRAASAAGGGMVLGATMAAAFYRASALKTARELLDVSVGPGLADVDLALRLEAAGFLAVVEPRSVVSCPPCPPGPKALAEGRYAERLFWKHAASRGWTRALAAHLWLVAGELACGLVRGGGLRRLAGRLLGGCDWGGNVRARLASSLPVLDPHPAPQRRIDDPRQAAAETRRRDCRRTAVKV